MSTIFFFNFDPLCGACVSAFSIDVVVIVAYFYLPAFHFASECPKNPINWIIVCVWGEGKNDSWTHWINKQWTNGQIIAIIYIILKWLTPCQVKCIVVMEHQYRKMQTKRMKYLYSEWMKIVEMIEWRLAIFTSINITYCLHCVLLFVNQKRKLRKMEIHCVARFASTVHGTW